MSKTFGYIVCARDFGDPLSLLRRSNRVWRSIPRRGVLFRGFLETTHFASLSDARSAIARSRAYFLAVKAEVNPYDGFEVYRVEAFKA